MRWTTALVVALVGGACDRLDDRPAAAGVNPPVVDTTNRDPMDGLSRQQIERSAQPMSPAQAEQMGIIDSTIVVEDQAPRDPRAGVDPLLPPPR